MNPLPEAEGRELACADETAHHDCCRRVCLGQIVDPHYPSHLESPEDELTRIALEDPEAHHLYMEETAPTFWRFVAIVLFAVVALGVVFVLK